MWSDIGQLYQFNESFIREFREKLNWYHICKHQKLSEDFMREFITKLWPLEIVKYQNVSLSFVKTMLEANGGAVSDYELSSMKNMLRTKGFTKDEIDQYL